MRKNQDERGQSRPQIAEKTPDLLLQAAKELFAKKGYDGTSVHEITERAGVNVSLVSYHFQGKEGLYKACLDQFGKEKLASAERLLKPASSEEEFRIRLRMFMEEMILSYVKDPEITQIIHRDVELEMPLTQEVFRERFLRVFQTLVDFIKAASSSGMIRKDADPLTLSSFFFGILTNVTRTDALNQRYFNLTVKDPKYRDLILDQALQLFCVGVLAKPDRDPR